MSLFIPYDLTSLTIVLPLKVTSFLLSCDPIGLTIFFTLKSHRAFIYPVIQKSLIT